MPFLYIWGYDCSGHCEAHDSNEFKIHSVFCVFKLPYNKYNTIFNLPANIQAYTRINLQYKFM
jgi:hypothetical protein